MRLVIAQRSLSSPGGSETFVLTLAEHFALLGHEVVVRAIHLGMAAELGRERGINIVGNDDQLPAETDATIALDRVMAIDLALRYPRATRLYAMHNADEIWLPPPEPGVVAATVAPNDRFATLARGCAGSGEVVRMRQPIDLYRFSPRGWAREKPARILLIGNYSGTPGRRIGQLQAAWSEPGLEWRRLGSPEPTTAVAEAMADVDIVVGYGRSILEAMSCGRPAYVHEHSGSDGWVTQETYARLEADGFAGTGLRPTPDLAQLREDFLRYDPALGRVGHDFARTHHDARLVAADLIGLIERLGPAPQRHDPLSLVALRNLAESRFRADQDVAHYRWEVGARARELEAERASRRTEIASLGADHDTASRALVARHEAEIESLIKTHGARMASLLARSVSLRPKSRWFHRLRRFGRKKTPLEWIQDSILFDSDWYLEQYPDVAAAKADPARHYLAVGFREGRDPGPCFSTLGYLRAHPDVVEEHNPLVHYEKYGWREGRRISAFEWDENERPDPTRAP
jgi:hypothetical protein